MNYKIENKEYFVTREFDDFSTMRSLRFESFDQIDTFLHLCKKDAYVYDLTPDGEFDPDDDPLLIGSRFCNVVHFESYVAGAI